ncbi:MAG: hypothetical protein LIO51_05715 [Clostridiales bacterium]|nr:hypothetical protein [Clostridiales bacterium]
MKLKKLLALLTALLMAVALTACGDGGGDQTADSASDNSQTETADADEEGETAEETDGSDETDDVEALLESADAKIQEGDYLSAIQILKDAIDDGKDDEAGQLQSALENAQEAYAEQVEIDLGALIGNEEYDSAKQLLSEAEEALSGVEAFENTKIWANAMIEAKIAYADGDYETAVSALTSGIDALGENADLESALEACKGGYENYLTEQVTAYVAEGTEAALTAADTLLETATGLIPGNSTVAGLKSTVTSAWQKLLAYTAAEVEFITYSDSIETEDQDNTYTFTPAVTGVYRFDFSGMMSGFEVDLHVYNTLNEEVAYSSWLSNGEGKSVTLNAGESYEVHVNQRSSTGSYTMTIGQAKSAINIDDYSTIYDYIEYTDQVVYYTFTPQVTGTYRFDFSEMVNGFEVDLHVYNTLNEEVAYSSWLSNGEGKTVTLDAGETYTITICQRSSTGSYIMSIGKQNETHGLTTSTSITGGITYDGQENKYTFTPTASASYEISANGMDSSFKVKVTVYDALGYTVESDTLQNESFTAELSAGETYTIVVSQSSGTGSYTLAVK